MTSVNPPVVQLPFPRAPLMFELAPEMLKVGRQAPVLRAELPDGTAGWLVTGYEQVRVVLNDPRFSRAQVASPGRELRGLEVLISSSLLGMDPPGHTRLRKLVAGAFTARRMRLLTPHVAAIVNDLLDGMLAAPPPADLVHGFSLPLPVRVICDLLGVPPGDQERFHGWSDTLLGDWQSDVEPMTAALTAMAGYIAGLIGIKRAAPEDDLISALIAMRDVDDRLSEDELVHLCIGILIGGHETTANQINLSLLTLLAHPAQLALLRAKPALIPGAVEEFMRYVHLGNGLPPARVASTDTTLGGVTILAGETVWPLFHIANRDPAVFPDPDRFDVARPPGTNLGFGFGIHHCLGAQLARIELQEAFRGLLTRLPGLRLAVPAGDLRYKEKMTVTSLHELPVTWDS
jgi:cytochrome P450